MIKHLYQIIAYSLLILLSQSVQGQMVNDNQTISITDGTTISVDTDLINEGQIINRGSLNIAGDWNNLGNYVNQSGQIVLSGSGEQMITDEVLDAGNLVISGGGSKILEDSLALTGNLNLTNGKLIIANGAKLVLNENATITGGNDESYVVGAMSRQGEEELFFPIGTDDQYLPVMLKDIQGVTPLVTFSVFDDTSELLVNGDLTDVAGTAYWQMTRDENYETASIVLPYTIESSDITSDRIVVAQTNSLDNNFSSLGVASIEGDDFSGFVTSEFPATGTFFTSAISGEQRPDVRVFNVLTPFPDGKHDFLKIENILFYENTLVEIFNRNGRKLFSMKDYNNLDRVFTGRTNQGGSQDLDTGNYFYTIRSNGKKIDSGFLFLKR